MSRESFLTTLLSFGDFLHDPLEVLGCGFFPLDLFGSGRHVAVPRLQLC